MDDIIKYILIGIAVLVFISIWIVLIKYIFIPISQPKLSANETFAFLENINCTYIEHKSLNKKELKQNHFNRTNGMSFRKMLSFNSEYKLIAYSKTENLYKLFWVEITFWAYTFGKGIFETLINDTISKRRELKYIEEINSKIIDELQSKYKQNTVIVTNTCPACMHKISPDNVKCNSCGLTFL